MTRHWSDASIGMTETAQENLARADHETLLTAFASLTHQLHQPKSPGHEISLRQQRDLVHDEIIRRMEGTDR